MKKERIRKQEEVMLNLEKFEEFISQYPIYEYRLISTDEITTEQRVRTV